MEEKDKSSGNPYMDELHKFVGKEATVYYNKGDKVVESLAMFEGNVDLAIVANTDGENVCITPGAPVGKISTLAIYNSNLPTLLGKPTAETMLEGDKALEKYGDIIRLSEDLKHQQYPESLDTIRRILDARQP